MYILEKHLKTINCRIQPPYITSYKKAFVITQKVLASACRKIIVCMCYFCKCCGNLIAYEVLKWYICRRSWCTTHSMHIFALRCILMIDYVGVLILNWSLPNLNSRESVYAYMFVIIIPGIGMASLAVNVVRWSQADEI